MWPSTPAKCHEAGNSAARGAAATHSAAQERQAMETRHSWRDRAQGRGTCERRRRFGRTIWRRWSGYHRRSRVETKMHCVKQEGCWVSASWRGTSTVRSAESRKIRVAVLNGFTALRHAHYRMSCGYKSVWGCGHPAPRGPPNRRHVWDKTVERGYPRPCAVIIRDLHDQGDRLPWPEHMCMALCAACDAARLGRGGWPVWWCADGGQIEHQRNSSRLLPYAGVAARAPRSARSFAHTRSVLRLAVRMRS